MTDLPAAIHFIPKPTGSSDVCASGFFTCSMPKLSCLLLSALPEIVLF